MSRSTVCPPLPLRMSAWKSTSQATSDQPRRSANGRFWLANGLSTAMGEAVSDWSAVALVPEIAVLLGFFAVALLVQLRCRRHTPLAYSATVAIVGIFGPRPKTSRTSSCTPRMPCRSWGRQRCSGRFLLWRRREGTVHFHDVTTASRGCCYWGAVVLTFTMGTALGDPTAVTLKLGYLASSALFRCRDRRSGTRVAVWLGERGRVLRGGLHHYASLGRLARWLGWRWVPTAGAGLAIFEVAQGRPAARAHRPCQPSGAGHWGLSTGADGRRKDAGRAWFRFVGRLVA